MITSDTLCTAFEGSHCVASGALRDVAPHAKAALDRCADSGTPLPVLVFNDATSEVIELDWRGSVSDFQARLDGMTKPPGGPTGPAQPASPASSAADPVSTADFPQCPETVRGPGRPKLGVVAREVTLLPRHWEWLGSQPGGASVALRKLVEAARRSSEIMDRVRQARAVSYKFMSTMAGHEAGFEEASRALFAGDPAGFDAHIGAWPVDVRAHLKKIAAEAFGA